MSIFDITRPAVCGLLLFAVPSQADDGPAIRSSSPVQVSADHPEVPHVEPILAAHPRDPSRLLGASITFPDRGSSSSLADTTSHAFVTDDGGETWRRTPLPECRADPWVAYDRHGTAYLSCHQQRQVGEDQHNAVQVFRSPDGGFTWEGPVEVPLGTGRSVDQPKLLAGPGGGIYLTFGQWLPAPGLDGMTFGVAAVRSSDGGRSFSEPILVRHDALDQQPFASAVLPDGSWWVAFMDYAVSNGHQQRLLHRRRSWLARSTDKGSSFSLPILLHEQVARELPKALAVDPSSGRVYVALDGHWMRGGEPPRAEEPPAWAPLSILAAERFGARWSEPIPVSDGPRLSNAEIPAIAVNPSGVVGVAWYDTRNDPGGRCFDIYFAASFDGGRSFGENLRVTPKLSCPGQHSRQAGIARRWQFGGDYSGLAAAADGSFHLLWADSRTGVYQLWSARIEVPTMPTPPPAD